MSKFSHIPSNSQYNKQEILKKKEGNLVINSELRALARKQLSGNWLNPILAGLAIVMVQLASVILQAILPKAVAPLISLAITLAVIPPVVFGVVMYFLRFVRSENPAPTDVTKGFDYWWKSVVTLFLIELYTCLWSLLLLIPGIVKACSYSMTLYILSDNPELSASEAINKSKEMMNGHKGQYFILLLSFIGWMFLAGLTLGIGYIWLIPYMTTSMSFFYESLKNPAMI